MKFKNIKSMAHNWTHSFMSGMNYVDGDFICEDMYKLARLRHGEKITVTWIPEKAEELFVLTPRIRESIKHYRNGLRRHLIQHDLSADALEELRTEVYVAENQRIYVRSYARDSRGKEYTQFVWA